MVVGKTKNNNNERVCDLEGQNALLFNKRLEHHINILGHCSSGRGVDERVEVKI